MRTHLAILTLLSMLALTACTTATKRIESTPPAPDVHTGGADVQVYYGEPGGRYETLDLVSIAFGESEGLSPSVFEVLPQLTAMAARLGGDAVVIRHQDYSPHAASPLTVRVEIIRFTT